MIKIALIDNGITQPVNLYAKKRFVVSNRDMNMHATYCFLIMQKYVAENVQIIDLKVLNGDAGNPMKIISAMKWCLRKKVDIISISCGTQDMNYYKIFDKWTQRLIKNKVIIISAMANTGGKSLPASLDNVIAVKARADLNAGEFIYSINRSGKFFFAGGAVYEITLPNGRKVLTSCCNSFATPMITGLISKYLANNQSVDMSLLCEWLDKQAGNLWSDNKKV